MDRLSYPAELFARVDETADERFYAVARKVVHIDDSAIAEVTRLYGEVVADGADVLDLMSSWRSHLPAGRARRVVGLGMNAEEMADNPQLDEVVVQNLNVEPTLAFRDASFDAVVCTVSIQYLTRPLEVLAEVARVLRPGGVAAFTFSNRCFPNKAVAAWLRGRDDDHLRLVSDYFRRTTGFGAPFAEDRSGRRGDPLYAVWAVRE